MLGHRLFLISKEIFVQKDDAASGNRYNYAFGDPVNWADLSGHSPEPIKKTDKTKNALNDFLLPVEKNYYTFKKSEEATTIPTAKEKLGYLSGKLSPDFTLIQGKIGALKEEMRYALDNESRQKITKKINYLEQTDICILSNVCCCSYV